MGKEIKNNSQFKKCIPCKGTGYQKDGMKSKWICLKCMGTGEFIDSHFIITDNKNKIAIDSDFEGK